MTLVPYIPENAPFSPEQRAYLNGFLAGLFSHVPATPGNTARPCTPAPNLKTLAILWASQTGNCENLAKKAAREAGTKGFAPTVYDLAQFSPARLAAERHVLVIASTYGDGEPPDNAQSFWNALSGDTATLPCLSNTRFSVCALGDSNYPRFCAFGKALDDRLAALGAGRVHPRVDCDVDFEAPFAQWLSAALGALSATADATPAPASSATVDAAPAATDSSAPAPAPQWSKSNPFPAPLRQSRSLSGTGSAKDVRHIVFELAGSDLAYEPGDALGVVPRNDPGLVDELIAALHLDPAAPVPIPGGGSLPLRDALQEAYEITRIPKPLLELYSRRTNDVELLKVTSPEANGELTRFLHGREVIDLVLAHPSVALNAAEFVATLRKLQPRLYSIASSPRQHPGEVHLTVGTVRYETLGRQRRGVCSTFLADRAPLGGLVPVFVHANKAFRPPADDVPLIMVGPGTGIAPFRAFLEDRLARGASGRNWLFFGDQRASTDFLYRDEIEAFHTNGLLTRLDLAWSRDQGHKVYVQDRMRAAAAELWSWLEAGAAFYVCGDASRMARDVDAALHDVVKLGGGKTPDEAAEYVRRLQSTHRYRRDVY